MAKQKSVFVCTSCGAESPKWIGKCNSCGEWNTYQEEKVVKNEKSTFRKSLGAESNNKPIPVSEVNLVDLPRINTNNNELNRVLGGGLVPGSLVLIGGEPGIGKSTLVLQTALTLPDLKVLYVSGEESPQQIKLRSERIVPGGTSNCLVVSEVLVEKITAHIENTNPDLLIIDSIQTIETDYIESTPGSVSQIRESTAIILKVAKEKNLPVILIGHINKEGSLAGPKVLEHMVDVVLQFEGDRNHMYRILRATKNRFGSTSELGIFEMQQSGLREVSNPSELLISQHEDGFSGVSICAAIEGMRPFLIEVQALVSSAVYGNPQRSTNGFDLRRLNMLLAVLEKRAGFKLATKDVFFNIAGGLKVVDPAIDLAVVAAVLSSNVDMAIKPNICVTGEVGLSGEIRPVTRIEQRITEAAKLGFEKILIPRMKKIQLPKATGIEIIQVSKIEEAFRVLFA